VFRTQFVILSALAPLVYVGCQRAEEITQYPVPKEESIQLPAPKSADGMSAESRPERMLGAILAHGDQTWFFKLSGGVDRVAEKNEAFRAFVQSLRFGADGTPQWTLPAGWTHQAGSGMRFATVVVDAADPPLELTVIALPTAEGDAAEQVLANVNRWRGQLALAPIDKSALPQETETLALPSGETATLVNYVGTAKASGGMTPPFAGGGGLSRPFAAPKPTGGESSAAAPFTAETPAGWSTGKTGGMRKAAFVVGANAKGEPVEMTVIDLSSAAGDRLANINRWRGQMGLDAVAAAELPEQMQKLEVGGQPGDYVELTGTKGESILGVIVDRGEQTWFFKLQGPSELVAGQKTNFETYVRSVTWK
jgi:hypothetical protein